MESNKLHEASYFFLQAISLDPGRKNPGYKRVEALWSPPPPAAAQCCPSPRLLCQASAISNRST